MKQSSPPLSGLSFSLLSSFSAACLFVAVACSSSSSAPLAGAGEGGTAATCEGAPVLTKADFCKSCTIAANASPNSCRPPRNVSACCTFVQAPTQDLVRGTGLNRNSSSDPTLNLGCLDSPGELGAPQTITLKGFVRVFSSGGD
jgi:hypothetical protein